MLGATFPSIPDIAFTAGGFLAPPFVEGFALRFLPATFAANPMGRWAIKIGSVILIALGVRQLIGRKEGNQVAVGGAVYLAATAVADFLPQLIGGTSTGTGYYNPGALASQPLLAGAGAYPGVGAYPGAGAYQEDVPERLRVGNRF